MAIFIVRVVLHANSPSETPNYDLLHTAMGDAHFSRQIQGDDGMFYHLPPAEYIKTGNFTMEQVHASAIVAVNKVGVHKGVITSEIKSAQWHLIPVNP